jgi:hypothetical protein
MSAIEAPDFRAPIIEGMEAAMSAFVTFKHFSIVRWLAVYCPPWLSVRLNSDVAGLAEVESVRFACSEVASLADKLAPGGSSCRRPL